MYLKSKYKTPFFLLTGISFVLFSAGANAELFNLFPPSDISSQVVIVDGPKKEKKTPHEIKKDFMHDCKKMMDYNYDEGYKCLKEAELIALTIPEPKEREKAHTGIINFISNAHPGPTKLKSLNSLISSFSCYTCAVMSEWHRLDIKLHQAKHYFEMEEHYRMVGRYIQDQLNTEKQKKSN